MNKIIYITGKSLTTCILDQKESDEYFSAFGVKIQNNDKPHNFIITGGNI